MNYQYIYSNTNESQVCYAKWKARLKRSYILHDSIYMTFWTSENTGQKTDQWMPDTEGRDRIWPQVGTTELWE